MDDKASPQTRRLCASTRRKQGQIRFFLARACPLVPHCGFHLALFYIGRAPTTLRFSTSARAARSPRRGQRGLATCPSIPATGFSARPISASASPDRGGIEKKRGKKRKKRGGRQATGSNSVRALRVCALRLLPACSPSLPDARPPVGTPTQRAKSSCGWPFPLRPVQSDPSRRPDRSYWVTTNNTWTAPSSTSFPPASIGPITPPADAVTAAARPYERPWAGSFLRACLELYPLQLCSQDNMQVLPAADHGRPPIYFSTYLAATMPSPCCSAKNRWIVMTPNRCCLHNKCNTRSCRQVPGRLSFPCVLARPGPKSCRPPTTVTTWVWPMPKSKRVPSWFCKRPRSYFDP